jgi:hypothetical protein
MQALQKKRWRISSKQITQDSLGDRMKMRFEQEVEKRSDLTPNKKCVNSPLPSSGDSSLSALGSKRQTLLRGMFWSLSMFMIPFGETVQVARFVHSLGVLSVFVNGSTRFLGRAVKRTWDPGPANVLVCFDGCSQPVHPA